MKIKRIAAISLSNRDFTDLDEKLAEACRWVSLAARMGCDLAVLPETMNEYAGDGPDNPRALSLADIALDDWQSDCAQLLECAAAHNIAVTVPIMEREGDDLYNVFHLVGRDGTPVGRYTKQFPTDGELKAGVKPRQDPVMLWEDIHVGGAICFDMNFPQAFARQIEAGAQLLLCPSLFPGGDQLNYFAATFQVPIALAYPAWSRIINPLGREVAAGGYRHETLRFGFGVPICVADINFDSAVFHFDYNQQQIEPILRRHGKDVWLTFDQENVRFMLESRSPQLTVAQIAREFELVTAGDYLATRLTEPTTPDPAA